MEAYLHCPIIPSYFSRHFCETNAGISVINCLLISYPKKKDHQNHQKALLDLPRFQRTALRRVEILIINKLKY